MAGAGSIGPVGSGETMSVVEAARALSISTREVLRRVDAGVLPIRRDVRGLPRIPVRAVEVALGQG